MAPVQNGRLLFEEPLPTGFPIPGKTTIYDKTQTIDLDNAPLNGGILLKVLVLSIDPYLRSRMSSGSYLPMYTTGEPLVTHGVGVIVRSENATLKPGDHVYGFLNFEEYSILNDVSHLRVLENQAKLPWSVYLGAAGMPGQTGYYGWKAYARPVKGETVFISTGASTVGVMVIQLAKRDGLRVIASAGSDEKVEFMKKIGADVAFNYKTTDTKQVLEKEGPIDIYWDNVGGETLDAALGVANFRARFIECGMVSTYNSGVTHLMKNLMNVIYKSITMQGLVVVDHAVQYEDEFYEAVPAMLATGELEYLEEVAVGLEKAEEVILSVQHGKNVGKSVLQVASE